MYTIITRGFSLWTQIMLANSTLTNQVPTWVFLLFEGPYMHCRTLNYFKNLYMSAHLKLQREKSKKTKKCPRSAGETQCGKKSLVTMVHLPRVDIQQPKWISATNTLDRPPLSTNGPKTVIISENVCCWISNLWMHIIIAIDRFYSILASSCRTIMADFIGPYGGHALKERKCMD